MRVYIVEDTFEKISFINRTPIFCRNRTPAITCAGIRASRLRRSTSFRMVGRRHHHARRGRRNIFATRRRELRRSLPARRSLCPRTLRIEEDKAEKVKNTESTAHRTIAPKAQNSKERTSSPRRTIHRPARAHFVERAIRFRRTPEKTPQRTANPVLLFPFTSRFTRAFVVPSRRVRSTFRTNFYARIP